MVLHIFNDWLKKGYILLSLMGLLWVGMGGGECVCVCGCYSMLCKTIFFVLDPTNNSRKKKKKKRNLEKRTFGCVREKKKSWIYEGLSLPEFCLVNFADPITVKIHRHKPE